MLNNPELVIKILKSKETYRDFKETRRRVRGAVANCPKSVSFQEALKQVKSFKVQ